MHMVINLGYGKGFQELNVCECNLAAVLRPKNSQVEECEAQIIRDSLARPIGTKPLKELVKAGEKVVVVVSDITRPVPSDKILPYVMEEIQNNGLADENITVVFALGSHRAHRPEEKIKLVGEEIYSRYQCVDSDPSDCVHMGETSMGTPVDISRIVAEADRRICIGNIEYHYFAGYSGGAKAIMPGCSTKSAIQNNHSKMTHKNARAANLTGNPVRRDLEEAIGYCPIDFIVNVILDEKKRIIGAVSGHFIEAHRAGCKMLDDVYSIQIQQKADIVVASQGGYPKDLNLYQLQKALDNAKNAVKDGGVIILAGSCQEGFGEDVFEAWMRSGDSPARLIQRIQDGFLLGAHKAAAIAMVMEKARIYLVSDMEEEIVRKMHMLPFASVQEAYDAALLEQGKDASVIVMPYGGSILPMVKPIGV